MREYEFAILGGGASGLSLALALGKSPNEKHTILLIEKEPKDRNDRTWCYWSRVATPLDIIRYHVWDKVRFVSDDSIISQSIQPYRYQMIRGIDYYQYMRQELDKLPQITFMRGKVDGWEDGEESASIWVEGEAIRATWVFDSRLNTAEIKAKPEKYRYLKQHFKGWEIETSQPVFDPEAPTLFDLRTKQMGGLCFFYILPFSPQRALVEYTLFSHEVLDASVYDQALLAYIQSQLGVGEYIRLGEESGIIPMTDHPFPRRLGNRGLAIGSRGGRVKPSTGYAFARIQNDTNVIVNSLLKNNHPFEIPTNSRRHNLYDALILDVLAVESEQVKPILTSMFRHNPIKRIFKFLDEETSLLEDGLVLASLPALPFLKALGRRYKRLKEARQI